MSHLTANVVSSYTAGVWGVGFKKETLDLENRHFLAGVGRRREEVLDTAVVKLHRAHIQHTSGLCPQTGPVLLKLRRYKHLSYVTIIITQGLSQGEM